MSLIACGGTTEPTTTPGANTASENPCGANPGASDQAGPSVELGVDMSDWKNWPKANTERFVSNDHNKAWADVYVTPDHLEAYKALKVPFPQGMAV